MSKVESIKRSATYTLYRDIAEDQGFEATLTISQKYSRADGEMMPAVTLVPNKGEKFCFKKSDPVMLEAFIDVAKEALSLTKKEDF